MCREFVQGLVRKLVMFDNGLQADPMVVKGEEVQLLLKHCHYDRVIYVGDGTNDFCPVTKLRSTDWVFARAARPLEKLLKPDPVTAEIPKLSKIDQSELQNDSETSPYSSVSNMLINQSSLNADNKKDKPKVVANIRIFRDAEHLLDMWTKEVFV